MKIASGPWLAAGSGLVRGAIEAIHIRQGVQHPHGPHATHVGT